MAAKKSAKTKVKKTVKKIKERVKKAMEPIKPARAASSENGNMKGGYFGGRPTKSKKK